MTTEGLKPCQNPEPCKLHPRVYPGKHSNCWKEIDRLTKERDAYREVAIEERTKRLNYCQEGTQRSTASVIDDKAAKLLEKGAEK